MATIQVPTIGNYSSGDTNANANTLVLRDGTGSIKGNTVTGSDLVTTGNFTSEVATETSSFTFGAAHDYMVDCTAGAVTGTLPSASANPGVVYYAMKKDSSGNVVTISGASGTTTISSQYVRLRIVSDGTTWYSAG